MEDLVFLIILSVVAICLVLSLFFSIVLLVFIVRLSCKINSLSDKINHVAAPVKNVPAPVPINAVVMPPAVQKTTAPAAPPPLTDFKPYEELPPDPDSLGARTDRLFSRVWNWICVGEEFRSKEVSAEYAIATAWLVRAGAVVLLCGIGFFLKYSFENNWVSPVIRVSGMGVAGVAAGVCGYWLSKGKYRPFGIGLLGIGAVTLYLSILAGYHLYSLFNPGTAYALMCVVTACAMGTAVAANALLPALLVCVGGYLTPLFLSTGQKNFIFLLIYFAILTMGVLYAAKRKHWILLREASFFLYGAITLGASADGFFTRENYSICVGLIVLNYLLFQLQGHLRPAGRKAILPELLSLSGNSVLFLLLTIPSAYRYDYDVFRLPAMFSFFTAAVSFGSYRLSRKREDDVLACFDAVLSAVLLAVTVPLLFRDLWIDAAWSLLALGFVYLSGRTKTKAFSVLADILFFLIFWHLIADFPGTRHPYLDGLTDRMLSIWIYLGYLALAGLQKQYRLWISGILFFLYSTWEIHAALREYLYGFRNGGVSVWWGLLGFAGMSSGLRYAWKKLRAVAATLFGLCVVKVFLCDLEYLSSLWRITAFLVLGVLLLISALLYMRFRSKFMKQ